MSNSLKKSKESMDAKQLIKKNAKKDKKEKPSPDKETKATYEKSNKTDNQRIKDNSESKDNTGTKHNKLPLIKKNLKGGNVVRASIDMINSMTALGRSIFSEIRDIKNIPADINNVAAATSVPNNNLKVR